MDYGYNLTNYRTLLEVFKEEGYHFASYCDPKGAGRNVLLRHDIDLTLEYAEVFARINAEAEVAGTFFLQLRCELYNLLSHEVLASVKRIVALGQHIGFHAVVSPETTPETVAEELHQDFTMFRSIVPEAQPVFAWHNPSVLSADGFSCIEQEFDGLVNTYGKIWGDSPPYYSDTNMRWTFDELLDLARSEQSAMQLAIAPMQWYPEEPDMPGVIASSLMLRLREMNRALRLNHVYKKLLPHGMPKTAFRDIRATIDQSLGDGQ